MTPLPMPREIYARDFDTGTSRAEFDRLLASADQSLELATPPGVGEVQLQNEPRARQDQYLAVGEFIARHCQVLIALWDGKPGQRGGTGEVVRLKLTGFHHDTPPGIDATPLVPTGPVFHITVPRERDGAREVAVTALWIYPGERQLRAGSGRNFYHYRIFKPLDDYNREVLARAAEEKPAMAAPPPTCCPKGQIPRQAGLLPALT